MRLRPTAWLLSMLLGMAACFGVPAASIAIPRASYSVVWPDKSADESAPRQEIAEPRETAPPPAESLPVISRDHSPAPATLLDQSLFQRPPPVLPSRP